ncbi:MAG: alpha-L-rhamnosidase N-terminal domain-containing protein, partial [Candidatus Hinthialibacter sp.]
MHSHSYNFYILFLGVALMPLLIQSDAAEVEYPIPITNAKWIAAEAPGAEEGEALSIGSQGVHVMPGESTPGQKRPLPIFRQSFILEDDSITSAWAAICGLGHFELSVNGEKAGDHFLDPPWSDYADTCYFVRFDVADLLKPGENVIGVMLGNGMYNVRGGRYAKFIGSFGPPKLIFCLVVSQGGKEKIILSDDTWKTDDGPITFSCIYGGEDYDARKEQPGWDQPGFDDSRWKSVKVVDGPGG